MTLQITFPDSSSADANVFARELRSALADAGYPPDEICIQRTDPQNMDLGSALEISRLGIEAILATHAGVAFGQVIYNFAKRNRSIVKIRSQIGNIDISTDTADSARLGEILKKVAELHRGSSPR